MIRSLIALILFIPSLAFANAYNTVVLADTPCHYWEMEDAATPIADSKNDGTCTADTLATSSGTPTYHATGIPGVTNFAVSYAAASSQSSILTNNAGASEVCPDDHNFTYEFWIKPASHPGTTYPVATGQGGGVFFGPQFVRGVGQGLAFQIWQAGFGAVIGTVSANANDTIDGTYHLVVLTTSGTGTGYTSWDLYIDGSTKHYTTSTFTGTEATCNSAGGSSVRLWAATRADATGFYDGAVDEIATYKGKILSTTRINLHYNCGFTGACTLGSAGWPFALNAPTLPQFRNPGYFDKFIAKGYNTGTFPISAMIPQYFNVGFMPFMATLPGNAK